IMKNDIIAGLFILLLLILIEIFDLIRIIIIIMMKYSIKFNKYYWLLNIIFPSLNGKRLIGILLMNLSKNLCYLVENDKHILSKMGLYKEINKNDLLKHIFISLIQIILLFIILLLIDINIFENKIINKKDNDDDYFNEDELDDDVLEGRIKLKSLIDFSLYPIVLFDIIKKYRNQQYPAINHLSFSIQQGECFALIGFNGAGKTSLFKIIVGEDKPTNGSIYIYGEKLNKIFFEMNRYIGYCE
ncbi:unnamed protein product, partial [Rotaria sp. Silwood2]